MDERLLGKGESMNWLTLLIIATALYSAITINQPIPATEKRAVAQVQGLFR